MSRPSPTAMLRLTGVRKDFGGLRPLRLRALTLLPGSRTAIVGLDAASAEVFVNLITGASLADEGTIEVFGRATTAVVNADDWLGTLDRFGIVSPRAVLMDPFTIAQNLAMALTLSLDPIPADVMTRVEAIAAEAGLTADDLVVACGGAPAGIKARCHLGRALAMAPDILILEHANALVGTEDVEGFGRIITRAADARGAAVLALTADERFARAVATTVYRHEPGSGALVPATGWRRWFRRSGPEIRT